jgi:hypothetical protein
MRERTGIRANPRGLNAFLARLSNAFAQSSTDHPLMNIAKMIRPPKKLSVLSLVRSDTLTRTGTEREVEIFLNWNRQANPVLQYLQELQWYDSAHTTSIDTQCIHPGVVGFYLHCYISELYPAKETAVNLKYPSVILATFSEDQRTILANGMPTWQDIFGFPAHTCEAGTVAAYVTPV